MIILSGPRQQNAEDILRSDNTKINGMGANSRSGGVGFRVWVPHAERISVIGSFNGANVYKGFL